MFYVVKKTVNKPLYTANKRIEWVDERWTKLFNFSPLNAHNTVLEMLIIIISPSAKQYKTRRTKELNPIYLNN